MADADAPPVDTPDTTPTSEGATPEAEAPAAAAATVAEPKRGVKAPRPIPIPKDSATFFRARAKNPKLFGFTADGNLQVPEMRGQAAKVIEIPYYRPSLPEEIAEEEAKRHDELVSVEKEYDEVLQQLKEAIVVWRTTGASSDVIASQRELARLDAVRTHLRSPVRWTKEFKSLEVRDLLFDDFYRVKKIGYPAFALCQRSVTFEEMTRIGELPTPEVIPEVVGAEADAEAEEPEAFVFFSDPADEEHGPLSPDTMVEFVYNSTKYNSIIQAYETERITVLGRGKDLRPLFLRTRSAAQVRALAARVVGEVEKPRELWIEILKALVAQHPRYAAILRATGKDTLVYASAKEGRWGIGLSADDPAALDKSAWKGPNILGQAWSVVRDSLPAEAEAEADAEAEDSEPVQKGGYTEHGMTRAEGMQVRKGILRGYYRQISK